MTSTRPSDELDYTYEFSTSAERGRVLESLTDEATIAKWWTAVTRAERVDDEIRLFMGGDAPLELTITTASGRGDVRWTVTACDFVPDWVGTAPSFSVRSGGDGTTTVSFRHQGLVPALECFDDCRAGWNHFMPSLERYLATGVGLPNQPRLASA